MGRLSNDVVCQFLVYTCMLQNFRETEKNEDGLYLLVLVESASLRSGATLAIFKVSGKIPFSKDFSS